MSLVLQAIRRRTRLKPVVAASHTAPASNMPMLPGLLYKCKLIAPHGGNAGTAVDIPTSAFIDMIGKKDADATTSDR